MVDPDSLHDAVVLLDGFEHLFGAGHQPLLQNVTLVVYLTVFQVVPVAFALGFDHHPQSFEVRLLEDGGR